MKVKKFRIKPRFPTVGKLLKAALGVKQLPEGFEESFPEESENFLKHTLPTALYSTWTVEEAFSLLKIDLNDPMFKEAVAISGVVATIGQGPEEYLAGPLMAGETMKCHQLTALAEESADLSFNFIARLLAEDAEHDGCLISEPIFLKDPHVVGELLTRLEADHEGISIDAAQHLTPRFTRVAFFAWIPIKKKKRQPVLSQNKTA